MQRKYDAVAPSSVIPSARHEAAASAPFLAKLGLAMRTRERERRSSIVHQAAGNWELGTGSWALRGVVRLPRVMTGPRVASLKGERCVRLWAGDAGVLTMMWMIGVFWRSQQAEEFPTRFCFSMNCRRSRRRRRSSSRGRRSSWRRIEANVRRCRRVALYDGTAETFV